MFIFLLRYELRELKVELEGILSYKYVGITVGTNRSSTILKLLLI